MDRPSRSRAQWIAKAKNADAAAREPLLKMLDSEQSAYWRAVAAGLIAPWAAEGRVRDALLKSLEDSDPLVREKAVRALSESVNTRGTGETPALLSPLQKLLEDPARSVRLSAAWALRDTLLATNVSASYRTNRTYGSALDELSSFLAFSSDQPPGQMQKGALALAHGDLPNAINHYEKAAAWDPNSAPIRHDLAVALDMAEHPREALAQIEAACRLEPKDAEYQFKLGLLWSELGDSDKSIAALEKTVTLDPRHARAWYNLGLARNAAGQAESALDALARAESVSPTDPEFPYARATVLLGLGRVQEARTAAARALELNPQFEEARKLIEQTR
jgi:tetratricopeptide (TPR) repeat protein